jgi:predicted RNase H-like nuclease (RuvC/YqgF family)
LAEEKESLSRQLAARGDATRDLASLRTQVERDEADLKTLRASNAELLSANQRLERQDRSSVDAARQLEQAQGTITRLQAENADLKTKVAALPATPTPAPAVAAEGSADELTRLKQELARARETVEMTVRSYALIRQENERLKAQLAKLQPAPAVASP